MADDNSKSMKSQLSGVTSQLPLGRLKDEVSGLGQAVAQRGLGKASERVESMTGRLSDIAEGKASSTKAKTAANVVKGDSPVKAAVKAVGSKVGDGVKDAVGSVGNALTGGGGGGKGGKLKVTNIIECVDVPVPRNVAYEQWTQFEDFPTFTKKVENVKQEEDTETTWKAQIFWSHRTWKAEIIDQVPNERIVWKSQGDKGHVDGAITFHELAPDLTRVNMVLEYYPKGLFEHTGNIWRAQGRRARLELKHFARHVSTQTLIHQDDVEGWPGEIHEGKVTDEDAAHQDGQDQGDDQKQGSDDQGSQDQGSQDQGSQDKGSGQSGQSGQAAKKASSRSGGGGGQTRKATGGQAPAKKAAKKTAKKTAAKKPARKSTG